MKRVLLLSAVLLLAGVNGLLAQARTATDRPRLVVVVAVDQMRADFMWRYAGLFRGGFARLARDGAVFTEAHHTHSGTETAPGHATLSTGSFPSRHGIVANDWFDRQEAKSVYAVADTASPILGQPRAEGRSPRRLLSDGLGDWLKRASPRSRVFSVSFKDRSAILMGGKRPDGAFWYNQMGGFATSRYYGDSYPAWVDSFNLARPAAKYLSTPWTRLLPDDAYVISREDSFPTEHDGVHVTFPHRLDSAATGSIGRSWSELSYTPFAEELLLGFAQELVTREGLGADSVPDILWISCSGADYVGHRYGPSSQESQDYFLRLDGYLADFFAFLDRTVGSGRYTLALSADHGGLDLPEELARRGLRSRRLPLQEVNQALSQLQLDVAQELGLNDNIFAGYSEGLMLHYTAARAKGVSPARLQGTVATRLRAIPFIADAYTAEELKSAGTPDREFLAMFRNGYYEGRSADVLIRYQPMFYLSNSKFGTGHGTAYRYDSHVPLIFAGAGIKAGTHGERVATADLAATLAKLLGVVPSGTIDGKVLEKALK